MIKPKDHIWLRPIWGADYSDRLATSAEALLPGAFARRWLPRALLLRRFRRVHEIERVLHSLRESLERTPWALRGEQNEHRCHAVLSALGRAVERKGGAI